MHEGLLIFRDLNTVQRSVAKFSINIKKKGGNVIFFYYETAGKASLISSMRPSRIFPDDTGNLGEEEGSKAIEQF